MELNQQREKKKNQQNKPNPFSEDKTFTDKSFQFQLMTQSSFPPGFDLGHTVEHGS